MLSLFYFQRQKLRQARRRFCRPLVEQLEVRELLANNVTISAANTTGMTVSTAGSTTTFLATAAGANVSVADIDAELAAGKNVTIDSGLLGVQTGTISTSGITEQIFNNATGVVLTLRSGSGIGSAAGDINITGLQLKGTGSIILDANDQIIVGGTIGATSLLFTAGSTITMPTGGLIQGGSLSMTAGGDVGTIAQQLFTSVSQLTTNTSANNNKQFITEANGLTALSLNAGTGNVSLNLTLGAVSDNDSAVDVSCDFFALQLLDQVAKDVGATSNPIATNVNGFTVVTVFGGGNQFLTQSKSLNTVSLGAGSGNVTLVVLSGSVTDTDASTEFGGTTVTVTLNDPTAQPFGSAANPINTDVDSLTINTAAGGGSQFVTEDNSLDTLDLNAGAGDITLVVTRGTVSDTDASTDIAADAAAVSLLDGFFSNFGSIVNPIGTSVTALSVNTSSGDGSQFIAEVDGIIGLNLAAGLGDITLRLAQGAIIDGDAGNDIAALVATVVLADPNPRDFGSPGGRIQTSVNGLSVDTSAGQGLQFITEADGLAALFLDAGTTGLGNISLRLSNGAVTDSDPDVDVRCQDLDIEQQDSIVGASSSLSFGKAANPIQTNVAKLTVQTPNSNGNQFIAEQNGLSGLLLNAGTGSVTLQLNFGGITDSDGSTDIVAVAATITLLDPATRNIGSANNSIQTNVFSLSASTAVGGGNIFLLEAGTTFVTSLDAGSGNITLTGGTFNLAGGGNNLGDQSTLTVNSPAVLNLASNDEMVGGLAGSGTVAFKIDTADHKLTVGLNNSNTTFSGNLSGNDVNGLGAVLDRFIKDGTGTLTLGGNNAFDGNYEVINGKLLVTGTLSNDLAFTTVDGVGSAASVLGGSGTINSRVTVENGHLSPGTSTGVLSMHGVSFAAGSAFDVEVTSASAGSFDQARVLGAVNIATTGNGVALNLSKVGTLNLANGNSLVIIDNDAFDTVTGTFHNLPEGTNLGSNFLGSGLTAKITYSGGFDNNDVVINLTPGSFFPWHNDTAGKANDVRGQNTAIPDGHVVADDALAIINFINANGSGPVPGNAVLGLPFGFLDTEADNQIVAGDVLAVINFINAGLGGEGESPMVEAEVTGPAATIPLAASPNLSADLLLLLATDLAAQPAPRRRG